MNLSMEDYHAMCFYDYKCGLAEEQCYTQMSNTWGDNCPSSSQISAWFVEFKTPKVKKDPVDDKVIKKAHSDSKDSETDGKNNKRSKKSKSKRRKQKMVVHNEKDLDLKKDVSDKDVKY